MRHLRNFIISAALMLAATAGYAQDVEFGVKGGLAISWLTNTVVTGLETVYPHNNFYAGGFATINVSDNFIIQPELIYAGKGHSDKSEVLGSYNRRLGYLQVPVYAGYRLSRKNYTVMAGPEFGYLLNSTTVVNGKPVNTTSECRRFNIALALQTNYMVTDNFGVDVKFDWGMNGTFKPNMYAEKISDKGRNVSLQIGVCYKF